MSNLHRQRLGKGLEALIPKTVMMSGKTITTLPVSQIKPNPYQPRLAFNQEALQQLSDSIKQHGLTQPIVVRRVDNHYELIAGERRFRACMLANMETIPAIIKNVTDKESLQLALIENLQREDLNAIEEAKGYMRLVKEFDLTHQALSEIFGKSRSAVTNTLRLLNLPVVVQEAVSAGTLSEGHARTLLSLETEPQILEAFEHIKNQQLNVREVEQHIASVKKDTKTEQKEKPQPLPLFKDFESSLSTKFNTQIYIKGKPNKGKIEIKYTSQEQLQQILDILNQ